MEITRAAPSSFASQMPGLMVSYPTPIYNKYDSTSSTLFMIPRRLVGKPALDKRAAVIDNLAWLW